MTSTSNVSAMVANVRNQVLDAVDDHLAALQRQLIDAGHSREQVRATIDSARADGMAELERLMPGAKATITAIHSGLTE